VHLDAFAKRFRSCQRADLEDLLQDVWLTHLKARSADRFSARSERRLQRLTKKRLVRLMREGAGVITDIMRSRRARVYELNEKPRDQALYEEELAITTAAIARLPSRERQALLISIACDFRWKPVAEVLGCGEAEVMTLIHKARKLLIIDLDDQETWRDRDGPFPRADASHPLLAEAHRALATREISRTQHH
jgi:DNA-directed RNA polymerase specialized sigma24 family protein